MWPIYCSLLAIPADQEAPMTALTHGELERLLLEDAPFGDLTTEALRIGAAPGRIHFAARAPMTVAAIEEAAALLRMAGVTVRQLAQAGDTVIAGAPLLEGDGPAEGLLRAWKVSQTLVEIWSGVASAARALVAAAQSARPDIVVACTRKNVPGTKALAIASIKAGGAVMHRLGLSETILVFPEHRVFRHDAELPLLARELRARAPEKKLVVEVKSVAEAIAAAEARFDVIQAEKFEPEAIAEVAAALARLSARPILAAAGGIHPGNAPAYARAGADVLVTSWPYTARPADLAVTLSAVA
jgi:molybdenum transport protein